MIIHSGIYCKAVMYENYAGGTEEVTKVSKTRTLLQAGTGKSNLKQRATMQSVEGHTSDMDKLF